MGQLRKLKFLQGSNLLDEQEMKNIRGGITCYIYDNPPGGSGVGGSGVGGSGVGSGSNYVLSGPCAMSDFWGCNDTCNRNYNPQGFVCFCY